MINSSEQPVEWAMLLYELDDAREHLESLANKMAQSGEISEQAFAIHLGHVYAHMNRAWNSRSLEGDIPEEDWGRLSQFPEDLGPVC